ncbi:MAG: squalene/phytoene synthase family protein [Reyranellaceae bacterium]
MDAPAPYQAPPEAHAYVLEEVRRHDRDRFLAALFAPEPARRDLLAILAFDHELARTRTVTREPLLAAIRLQWWREAVEEAAGSAPPRAQPLVQALSEAVRRRAMAAGLFEPLLAAREAEADGPPDAERLGAALADLGLAVLGVDDAPSRAAAGAVMAARLTAEDDARARLTAEARVVHDRVDGRALPLLLPALALDRGRPAWRRPLDYWWAARRGRY